jgi:hypothetical protein
MREVATWPQTVQQYVYSRNADGCPLKWNEKLAMNSDFATTLLAMQIRWRASRRPTLAKSARQRRRRDVGEWYAVAVGDTNIFHVRDDTLICSFPIQHSSQFDHMPNLIATNTTDFGPLSSIVQFSHSNLTQGDIIYLCTDALAAWFLRQHEKGYRPWETLNRIGSSNLSHWLMGERKSGEIDNDDVTLVRIDCF